MYRTITLAALLLAAFPVAGAGADAARPMSEMHGGCDNFLMPLTEEFALWAEPATEVVAGKAPDQAPAIAAGTRYAIALSPQAEVRYATPPLEDRGGADRYGGLLSFKVPQSGSLRISAGSGVWIDVETNGTLLPATSFEMQTKCDSIFKVVTFAVEAGQQTFIQLNGSRQEHPGLLLTYEPGR